MGRFVGLLIAILALNACVVMGDIIYRSCGSKCSWYVHPNGTLEIKGDGAKIDDYIKGGAPWYNQSSSITALVIRYGAKKIGDYAFYGLSNMATCSLPVNMEKMGKYAFYGCSSLRYIRIPSVEKVKRNAFYGCSSLTSVVIPYGVTEIQSSSFFGCESLTSVTIPGSAELVDFNAFKGCTSLVNVTIKSGVQEIKEGAFKGCTSLETVTILGDLDVIDDCAFEGCTSLKQVIYRGVRDPLETGNPFKDCDALDLVCIPRYYESDSFCTKTVYPQSLEPQALAEDNHCFEALICNQTYGIVRERYNVTSWENRTHSCFSFFCDNETGGSVWTKCNSTNKTSYICFDNRCYDNDNNNTVEYKGWSVVVAFNNVSASHVNGTYIIEDIRALTGMKNSIMRFASEIDPDNYLMRIFIIVDNKDIADSLKTKLETGIASANCTYDIICQGGNISIVAERDNTYSSAYRSYVSLFLLFFVLIISVLLN